MISNKKVEFKVNDRNYYVKDLSNDVRMEGQKIYNIEFKKGLDAQMPLRMEIEETLRARGLYNSEADDLRIKELSDELKLNEIRLRRGENVDGSRMTKEQGCEVAFRMKELRSQIGEVGSGLSDLMQNSVENYANNYQMQYFIYACTYQQNGSRYWNSFDDFLKDAGSEVSTAATKAFVSLMTNVDSDFEKKFYENKWLIRQGFMNDKMQLINADGCLVDKEGRLINEDGRYINDKGEFVDRNGNRVNKDGELLEEDVWESAHTVEVPVLSS